MGRQADARPCRLDAPVRGADLSFYVTLTRLFGQFRSYAPDRWEIIPRESAIFGILDVTTQGFHVDALSWWLRRALHIEALPVRLSSPEPVRSP